MQQAIPYGHHDIGEGEINAAAAVLSGEWLTTGPSVREFEKELMRWTGNTPTVAVSSGTAALHCAFTAVGLGPGDEVITPPLTFVATQAAAIALGAQPVFADVCSDTGNLDPVRVEEAITPATKAIVAVDYAGHPADMDELSIIAQRHGLLLIEDAAHSLGSTYKGRAVGSLADLTTFSFFPTKNITTGEGGAISSRDPDLLRRAGEFGHQGLIRDLERLEFPDEGPWHQEVHEFGLNYRLSDVLASVGTIQLQRLEGFKSRRSAIKKRYDSAFSSFDSLRIPFQRDDVDPVWHLYPLRVPAAERRRIFMELRAAGILVQVNYLPAYRHPAFARIGYADTHCPNAEAFYESEISLPIFTQLTDADVDRIIEAVQNTLIGV